MRTLHLNNPVGSHVRLANGREVFMFSERWRLPIYGVGILEADAGCWFDGQSIPNLSVVRWIAGNPYDAASQKAAAAHDLIGRAQLPNLVDMRTISYAEWNGIFYDLDECGQARRAIKYGALMAAGWVVWNSHRANEKQIATTRRYCRMLPME